VKGEEEEEDLLGRVEGLKGRVKMREVAASRKSRDPVHAVS
jgi:hypothetical protein